MEALQLSQFFEYLQPRLPDSHKGNFGHVLIVGGNLGYSGSVRLAAEAALRVGAGLVTVVTHPEHAAILNATCPELMCRGVEGADDMADLLDKVSVIVIGPGLGMDEWGRNLFDLVLDSQKPLVVDADGLNILAEDESIVSRTNWILTPHPGEAGRLLKVDTQEVQSHRLTALKKLQEKFSGVTVLKGAGTLVLSANSSPAICEAGNPGMATAGMGDVLSGVIGSLVAQQVPLLDAAKLGVLLHALAGDLVAKEYGERGMMASDLMPSLQQLANWNMDE